MSDLIKFAKKIRPIIEQAAVSLDDQTASQGPELFPMMKFNGGLIKGETRINWFGKLKRAAVDLWDREDCTPETAPELWEDIDYVDGVRIIPETITSTLAFKLDELGWWDGNIYKSLRDGNCYNPSVTPEWWALQE